MERNIGKTVLRLIQGDITKEDVDAIVNAANPSLMGGGGVDGAIHRAGGPAILEECKKIRARQGRLPTGQAVITTAGNMKARYVIHTVGPIWHGGGEGEEGLLRSCYRESLRLAVEKGCKTIAFPAISTGVYGYPMKPAAISAIQEVVDFLKKEDTSLHEVRFVLFDHKSFHVYQDVLSSLPIK
jgi:O-acetyl-ADP-ribose deacetylase (regulator of RNase III)